MNNNILYSIYTNFFNIQKNSINLNDPETELYKSNKVHLMGIFDRSLKIWYNAWAINNYSNIASANLSKELLIYFINHKINTHNNNIIVNIVKSIICSSKIYITEYKTQLHLILAIFLYYTKQNFFFIQKKDNLFYFFAYNKNTSLIS